jgi:hypothetical protein
MASTPLMSLRRKCTPPASACVRPKPWSTDARSRRACLPHSLSLSSIRRRRLRLPVALRRRAPRKRGSSLASRRSLPPAVVAAKRPILLWLVVQRDSHQDYVTSEVLAFATEKACDDYLKRHPDYVRTCGCCWTRHSKIALVLSPSGQYVPFETLMDGTISSSITEVDVPTNC